jgi:hypothetical protein
LGLALAVFGVVGLTGPGRIDIEDGQTRFESGRSLIEHGDTAIRDSRLIWFRLPGRGGLDFTRYRFPQELIAAGCIWIADATGPVAESRRHFFFSLHGAVAAAALAAAYAVWFRRRGRGPASAVVWAAGGVFCTPCWYYATSTFDDILGSLTVVAAVVLADGSRKSGGWRLGLAAGCVGLALNCKPPLSAVLLPALALTDDATRPLRARLGRAAVLGLGFVAGYAAYAGYEAVKFPPANQEERNAIEAAKYPPFFFAGDPVEALLDYAVGPSAGSVWYFPPVLLCVSGLGARWRAGQRRVVLAVVVACGAAAVFFSMLTFYKGGVCWGPRYLTPLFALLWLFAPDGVGGLGRRLARLLLTAGVGVQLLGLAVVPERLYLERQLPSTFYLVDPWLYFHPAVSHLLNRPRELIDALTAPPAPEFTPAPAPTFTLPVLEPPYYTGPRGVEGVRQYTLLNSLRPWWATFGHLTPDERPVALGPTAILMGWAVVGGLVAVAIALLRVRQISQDPTSGAAPCSDTAVVCGAYSATCSSPEGPFPRSSTSDAVAGGLQNK